MIKTLTILLFPFSCFCQQKVTIKINKKVQVNNIPTLPSGIAFFGDSFTKGGNPDGGTTYAYKIGVDYPTVPITVYAVGGTRVTTTSYAPTGGNNLIDLYTTELNKGYTGQLVSFCYGQNDASSGTTLVNASWKATYKGIIQQFITAGWPLTRLLIQTPPHTTFNDNLSANPELRAYTAEIASELGILFFDVHAYYIASGNNDGLFDVPSGHPLNVGQIYWENGYKNYLMR